MVTMFEDAYKQQPGSEELGAQTFFANIRAQQWKSAQQVKRASRQVLSLPPPVIRVDLDRNIC